MGELLVGTLPLRMSLRRPWFPIDLHFWSTSALSSSVWGVAPPGIFMGLPPDINDSEFESTLWIGWLPDYCCPICNPAGNAVELLAAPSSRLMDLGELISASKTFWAFARRAWSFCWAMICDFLNPQSSSARMAYGHICIYDSYIFFFKNIPSFPDSGKYLWHPGSFLSKDPHLG